MKKLILITVAALLGVISIRANAQTWNCGYPDSTAVTAMLVDSTLTIVGTGNMADYGFDNFTNAPWYNSRASIKTVIIEDGVTSVGACAFYDCKSLTTVTISDSVVWIGNFAFTSCSALTTVTFPNSVLAIVDQAFLGCESLTTVTIPSGVYAIVPRAFALCTALTSIDVDPENANYCSVDGVLFSKDKTVLCQYPMGKEEATYTIPDSVTTIKHGAFELCWKLTSIAIPNSVTTIGFYAFVGCSGLTSITIPNSVTSIGHAAFGQYDNTLDTIRVSWETPLAISNDVFHSDIHYGADLDISEVSLIVPCNLTSVYENSDVWGEFRISEDCNSVNDENLQEYDNAVLHAYPNPTTGIVSIDNPDNAEISAYTLSGALIERNNGTQIDLGKYPQGMYILHVGNKSVRVVKK